MNRIRLTALPWLAVAAILASSCRDAPKPVRATEVPSAASPSGSPSASAVPASAVSVRALPAPSRAVVKCPMEVQNKKRAELEALAAEGDLCAMGELGPHLFFEYDVAAFRRGADLLKRAFEGGADVRACWAFGDGVGMKPDWDLGLACLQRREPPEYPIELLAYLTTGDGVTRFLDRAEEVAMHAPADFTYRKYFLDAIQKERTTPTKEPYNYCDMGSSSLEMLECAYRKRCLDRWQALLKRAPAVEAMIPTQRAAYDQLVTAFARYRDDDMALLEYFYADAHGPGLLIPGPRRTALDKELDDLFEQIVVRRPLAAASREDLDHAKADLAHAEKRSSEFGKKEGHYDPAKHRQLWAALKASWDRYWSAWIKLGGAMAGRDAPETRTQVGVLVMRARVETLQTGWAD